MGIYTLSFLDSCVPVRRDAGPIGNPLNCIEDHNLAERQVCAELDRIAGEEKGTIDQETLADVIRFLSVERPIHLQDEAEDLFPTMRVRCEPEDEIDRAIEKLSVEHANSNEKAEGVLETLRALQEPGRALSRTERSALMEFSAQTRRHLVLENAVLMPIAHARLKEADLERMRQRMMLRRQRYWMEKTPDAE